MVNESKLTTDQAVAERPIVVVRHCHQVGFIE